MLLKCQKSSTIRHCFVTLAMTKYSHNPKDERHKETQETNFRTKTVSFVALLTTARESQCNAERWPIQQSGGLRCR
jgi:hypothetical protein